MSKRLNIEIEKAIRILVRYLPVSQEDSKKPIIAHSVRVGVYLYENNYSREIILAGFLHDMLELGSYDEQQIGKEFGEEVVELVKACTREKSIEDANDRLEELMLRCAKNGKDSLIVKAADVLDDLKYYAKEDDPEELEYCRKTADKIFRFLPIDLKDKVFEDLEKWMKKNF